FGWFHLHGARAPPAPGPDVVDIAKALNGLPVIDLVKRVRPAANGYEAFLRAPLTDPFWNTLDYVSDSGVPTTPAMVISTWGDQTVGDTLALAELLRRTAPEAARTQKTILSPAGHCGHDTG